MDPMVDAGLQQVERDRRNLEEKIAQLRKALHHWHTSEVDYEGLIQEVGDLPVETGPEEILTAAKEFHADFVDDAELQKLVYTLGGSPRARDQVVRLLQLRLENASRNARAVEMQLGLARKRRNALLLAENSEQQDEAELPLMDITEELDDEGNVVSSRVEPAAASASELVNVLTQVGVTDAVEQDGITIASGENEVPHGSSSNDEVQGSKAKQVVFRQSDNPETSSKTIVEKTPEDTQDREVTAPSASEDESGDDEDELGPTHPDDTPEEAALRRQMLQYGLGELGAIVGELELEEEPESDIDSTDAADLSFDDFEDVDSDEENSEDECGMVKHPTMSKEYLNKMKKLENKYGIQGMQNLGPDASKLPKSVQDSLNDTSTTTSSQNATLAREARKETPKPSSLSKGASKSTKKVAFSPKLDFVSTSNPSNKPDQPQSSKIRPPTLNTIDPVKSTIVEHQSPSNSAKPPTTTTKKPSRFKSARSTTPQTPLFPPPLPPSSPPSQPSAPNPPSNALQTDTVIERPPSTATPSTPDPSDIDASLHAREVAEDYYKLRNRMIGRQDGFVAGGEAEDYGEEEGPWMYRDGEGRERRVSRFMAARLK